MLRKRIKCWEIKSWESETLASTHPSPCIPLYLFGQPRNAPPGGEYALSWFCLALPHPCWQSQPGGSICPPIPAWQTAAGVSVHAWKAGKFGSKIKAAFIFTGPKFCPVESRPDVNTPGEPKGGLWLLLSLLGGRGCNLEEMQEKIQVSPPCQGFLQPRSQDRQGLGSGPSANPH